MVRIVKKPAVRRQEIVEAALHLFQTKGYERTAVQDVMVHLGIAKGTIYHYFDSKEALLEAVIARVVDEDVERLQALMTTLSGNALDRIRILIAAGNAATNNQADLLEQLHQPANTGMHTRILAASLNKQAPLFAALIQQGRDEGLFQTEAPLECAEFILAAVQFLTDADIHAWTKEDLARRRQALPALIEAVLKAPEGSFQFLFER
jgi:AcrR family transcriptional regulator